MFVMLFPINDLLVCFAFVVSKKEHLLSLENLFLAVGNTSWTYVTRFFWHLLVISLSNLCHEKTLEYVKIACVTPGVHNFVGRTKMEGRQKELKGSESRTDWQYGVPPNDESMDETIGPGREAIEDVSPTGKSICDDSDEGSTGSEMLFE